MTVERPRPGLTMGTECHTALPVSALTYTLLEPPAAVESYWNQCSRPSLARLPGRRSTTVTLKLFSVLSPVESVTRTRIVCCPGGTLSGST